MALKTTPICDIGNHAPDFSLSDPDGKIWSLENCRGENGTLIMFICNHCPYVQAIHQLLVRDTLELLDHGVKSVAIMSNDINSYPMDSPENMKKAAEEFGYPFPYLFDETQATAQAYGAVCTPDFFGYNANQQLQYRGRLDETTPSKSTPESKRELFEAMKLIARTGEGPDAQIASMGCSIKWRQ
tara:strand:- start:51 stop:605 length:555 start_codon:yes stop_codon:yes gene_type:complete